VLSNTLRSRAFASFTSPNARISAVLLVLCLLCAWGAVALAGTKTGMAIALVVALGPIAIYLALTAPIVFPFALYLILVPFDNLLAFHSFGTLTKLLGLCSAAAIAMRFFVTRKYIMPDRAVLAWLPFLILSIASLTWAIDPKAGIQNVLSVVQLFALYALLSFTPIDRKTLGIVITAVIVGGVLASGYGAYLFHKGVNVSEEGRLFINTGDASIDPNHFAAALLVPLALTLVAIVEARRLSIRAFAAVAMGFIGIGILVSGSRGALLSVIVMVAYLIYRSRKRMILIGLSLAGGGIGLAGFGHIVDRFNQIEATGGAGRLGIWRVALHAIKLRPIFGAGAGNFPLAYNDSFLSVPAFASMKTIEDARWSVAPHNDLIWAGVELGILGLAALLYAWWMQYRALRVIPERSELHPLRIAIEAALIGQFVCGLFLGTLTYKYLWLAFMLAMILRNAELDKGGLPRESVVSPVLQTATRRI
jgi:O-antigen ligase